VQTACSTATVAAHLAYQSLLRGECDMCLAGGAQIRVPQGMGYLYQEGGFPSPDGHCRSFDARAKGNVHGNGAGLVLLKRLADALRDGDHVYAVIKGSAACNDGSVKVGYTAPGVDGQVRAAAEALVMAGVEPESVGYLEATGTATELGDPIEIEALTRAYRTAAAAPGRCAIGSVKSNIGHLDVASGAAALIKCALVLERELIPPSLHFETPNPRIDFASSPFFVNTEPRPWRRGREPRRAAVHTYAVGGTNTHLVLEEAPPAVPGSASRPWQLLPLAARTSTALHRAADNLAAHLRGGAAAELADVAFTLKVGRRAWSARRAVLCRDGAEAAAALAGLDPERVWSGLCPDERRQVALLLPGGSSVEAVAVIAAVAGELYAAEPTFREELDRCAELLLPGLGTDLRPLLGCGAPRDAGALGVGGGAASAGGGASAAGATPVLPATPEAPAIPAPPSETGLADPRLAEPARFAFVHALACLWLEWGVRPVAVAGWGAGELAGACLAGVLSLADAASLVVARGRALAACAAGSRLEIEAAEESLTPLLGSGVAVEAVLGPRRCRVAGGEAAITALQERLNEEGIDCLHLGDGRSAAWLPAAAREAYRQALAAVTFHSPEMALWAGAAGAPLGREEAAGTTAWERQLAAPARLGALLSGLLANRQLLVLALGSEQDVEDAGPVAAGVEAVLPALGAAGRHGRAEVLPALSAAGRQGRTEEMLPALGEAGRDAAGQEAGWEAIARDGKTAGVGGETAAGPGAASAQASLLAALGRLWVAGVEPDWAGFYRHERRLRVPLPTYPFERRRIWAEPTLGRDQAIWSGGGAAVSGGRGARRPVAEWFHALSWRRSEQPAPAAVAAALPAGTCLILADAAGLGDRLAERLRGLGRDVVSVHPGRRFAKDPAAGYRLDPRRFDDHARLLADLTAEGRRPAVAVHLWSLHGGDGLGSDGNRSGGGDGDGSGNGGGDSGLIDDLSFWSLHHLGRALGESTDGEVRLEVVTAGTQEVTGDEELRPAAAACLSACLVIPREYPQVRCRSIDLILPPAGGGGAERQVERLAGQLLGELARSPEEPVVAFRGAHRWVQASERLRLDGAAAGSGVSSSSAGSAAAGSGVPFSGRDGAAISSGVSSSSADNSVASSAASFSGASYSGGAAAGTNGASGADCAAAAAAGRLRQRGVYVVAGGLQGFGLMVAGHLARTVQARLALVGDTGLPARESWDDWLAAAMAAGGEGDETVRALREIHGWEAQGAEVLVADADLADAGQVRAALAQVRARFGAIHGVFFAAAEQGEELARRIADLDRDFLDYRLRARLGGLRSLAAALPVANGHEESPDFVLLAGTVAAVIGGPAVAADCCADVFLDLFARQQGRRGATAWTSVDWDAFQPPGAAAGAGSGEMAGARAAAGTGSGSTDGVGAAAAEPTGSRAGVAAESAATGAATAAAGEARPGAASGAASGAAALAITAAEGAAAFSHLLALPALPQVVVSTVDLAERLLALRTPAVGAGAAAAPRPAREARERPPLKTSYVGPRSEVETQVAGIWAEVLGMREVGVEDDFFDLGGNSLLATQLVSRLRGALQVSLALQDFFAGATVAAVAERVQITQWPLRAWAQGAAAGLGPQEMGEI
jgi:acyl transferase domain-containing protein/acyl carrier protein